MIKERNRYVATAMMKPPKLGNVVPTSSYEKLSKNFTPISAINKRPFGFLSGLCLAAIMPMIKEKEYDFICVARFSKLKNHHLLLEAFDLFWKKNQKAKLICVGGGELKDEIKTYLETLDCKNNVFLNDPVDDVYPFLYNSSCFVLSSIYEGNPISILEAFDAGLPIIAPNVGGIPDVVKDKENGVLFEVGSVKGLVDAFTTIYNNSNMLEQISLNNKIKSKQFGIENVSNEYYKLFITGR